MRTEEEERLHRFPLLVLSLALLLVLSSHRGVAQPQLQVSSPQSGDTIDGSSVTVSYDVSGFTVAPSTVPLEAAGQRPEANRPEEGHVHLMLDLLPVVVLESTEPYTFTNVQPGEHQLVVELVNNDHSPLSPPIVQTVRFRTTADQMLPRTGQGDADRPGSVAVLVVLTGAAMIGGGLILRRKTV